ncbi:major facilitator superfamily domain containing 12a [Elysia marginata]|uniref:Major facilitator superfamily domain containing 12a n=1 Tax=Elysia marginata TaxID=1093978 RepID=A0AAV4JU46_9GAST|nr:major facilitator superfamily domain containing 12a [Elysia marginata]
MFENVLAGNLMLIGQVSDALCTPFIGLESDQTRGLWKLGKRKTWHLVGTFSVMASFVFLFSECITCSHAPNIAQFVYYVPFVIIFQFGWAATQISHLSYSSDITPYKHERVTLQSVRNSFTVIANLSVYGLLTLLFYLGKSDSADNSDNISPDDAPKFRNLALICLAIGTLFNCIFYLGTKNCTSADTSSDRGTITPGENSIERSTYLHGLMTWRCWLKQLQFYQVSGDKVKQGLLCLNSSLDCVKS